MEKMMRDAFEDRMDYFRRDWRLKLERVYAEGLRDGFVQGVESA